MSFFSSLLCSGLLSVFYFVRIHSKFNTFSFRLSTVCIFDSKQKYSSFVSIYSIRVYIVCIRNAARARDDGLEKRRNGNGHAKAFGASVEICISSKRAHTRKSIHRCALYIITRFHKISPIFIDIMFFFFYMQCPYSMLNDEESFEAKSEKKAVWRVQQCRFIHTFIISTHLHWW